MKWTGAILAASLAVCNGYSSLAFNTQRGKTVLANSAVDEAAGTETNSGSSDVKDPLLIRAARGETVERTPVWMMRQAGRHIQEYRDLCKKYPTFRQRSEIPEVAVEVSLQPWRNYQTDGCILFSDILTPLPGVGCEFTIDEKLGPVMEPMKNWDDIKKVNEKSSLSSLCKNYVLFWTFIYLFVCCMYTTNSSVFFCDLNIGFFFGALFWCLVFSFWP